MKKNDILLIGVLVLVAGVLFLGIGAYRKRNAEGLEVVVKHAGQVVKSFPLSATDTVEYVYIAEGARNEIVMKNGKVYVSEANCRDQICVKTHAISQNGEIIVCLPHQLTVEIYAERIDGEQPLDGIVD